MQVCSLLPALWAAMVAAAAGPAATQPAAGPSQEVRLAVAGLVHQARSLGHQRAPSVARTERIRILLQYADRLWPENGRTNRQLLDLYEGLGEVAPAADAARRCLLAEPADQALGARWLRLAQATLNNADQRIELLEKALADERLGAGIRAEAAAQLCDVYLRQSDNRKARLACAEALRRDPYLPGMLAARQRLSATTAPAEALRGSLTALRGDPRSLRAAWAVGRQLQQVGLAREALTYYDLAYAVSRAKQPADEVMEAFLIDYINAMLDAGLAARAGALLEPLMVKFGGSLALRALIVETYRLLGKQSQAKAHIEAMAEIYAPLTRPGVRRTAGQAAELAWFHLAFKPTPKVALAFAEEAAKANGDDPFVQRALGRAELAGGKTDAGVNRLKALAGKDPLAAVVLASHYATAGDAETAAATLRKGTWEVRTGVGWRELAAAAAKHQLELAPLPAAQAARKVLKDLPAHVLAMGQFPERFVRLSLSAVRAEVAPGEPVEVAVTVENTSAESVPLGQGGLFRPVVFLGLTIAGAAEATFANLTPVSLPAPRFLRPGQKVTRTTSVDVGPAEAALLGAPLAELKLTVTGLLDPLQLSQKLFSSAPGIKIQPVVIRRKGLLDPARGELAARYALGYIVRDLQQGDLATQVRAARQTGSLLAHVCAAEAERTAAALPKGLEKPVLLSMMQAFLRDRSSVVRSEMLAALHHVKLDDRVISLTGPCIEDASPLVRLRLIDLLAAKDTKGHQGLLEIFARDRDALVREMAKALTRKK